MKDQSYFDEVLQGFGIRVWPSGQKTYFAMARARGRKRRVTIGRHGAFTPEQARQKARTILADLSEDKDPTSEKDRLRKAPTMETLCERFIEDYVPMHCKPSTAKEYKRSVDLFILPHMKYDLIADVTRADVVALHHGLRDKPYQANRTLGVLSVMFTQAEIWGLRTENTNPCFRVKRFKEEKRERFLSEEELKRLGEALEMERAFAPAAVDCVWLLITTGCRLGEIQKLQWRYVDLTHNVLHLPDSKTGKKIVYLGEAAVEILRGIEKVDGNPHVITGNLPGQFLTDMQKPWRRIRKSARIEDVRLHDLRHTFASRGIAIGEGLPIIGNLLGHSQPQTTARYTHLANHHAIAAASRISQSIMSTMRQDGPSQETL